MSARRLDPALADRRIRWEGGKLHVHDPGHGLARPDGWVVAARWLAVAAWPTPTCECGLELSWTSTPAAQAMHLDGDRRNVTTENLRPSCHACAQRARFRPRKRDGRGRWR